LGDRDLFVEHFANPIADGHREPLTQLRALVRHFILRRTKAQVLDELPPRTDTTIVVEPSAAARAFYEARRRHAQKKVEDAPRKKKKITALAEITKLRQAAVDPRVCDPSVGPPGAKIDVLLQELSRLAESDHRALVFTQFLDSLALIEQGLQKAGIAYQTLQGSTPAAERAERIAAFSAGEGVVFLASLRAGGIGVNLTAADFVYHVDPWWNPAVEDQATDRAHRIGQTRPVQVYRLVTAGTIEEKILQLHARKRGLADGVLQGLQAAQALDLDELVALLGG
jgi:SNF2 family DNA or RNA helicase